jgi:RHS repeat-associated protein
MITMWNVAVIPSARAARVDLDLGSGLQLHLDERRVTGRAVDSTPTVSLTGAELPENLTDVLVEGRVGDHVIEECLSPGPNLRYPIDAALVGGIADNPATTELRVGWRFARRGMLPSRTRWWRHPVLLEGWDARSAGLGGFTPSSYHRLDPVTATIWTGNGRLSTGADTMPASAPRARSLGRIGADADDFVVVSGPVVHVFDRTGRHRHTVDPVRGRTVARYRHDEQGHLSGWHSFGSRAEYGVRRDPAGTIITAPGGQWAAISVDATGRAVGIDAAVGARIGIGYDDDGLVAESTGPRRQWVRLTHDSDGAVTSWRRDAGPQLDLVVDENESRRRISLITGTGREFTTIEEWAGNGATRHTRRCCGATAPRVTVDNDLGSTIQHPDGSIERRVVWADRATARNRRIERTTLRTPAGRTTTSVVSRSADPEGITVATTVDGRTTHRRFDAASGLVSETAPDGREHTTTLVPNRQMRVRRAGMAEVVVEFTDGLPTQVRHGDRALGFEHDEYGRLSAIVDGDLRREIHHDAAGRVVAMQLARGWVRFEHDEAGDIIALTTPNGATTRFERAADGLVEAIIGPTAPTGTSRIRFVYDDNRELVSRIVEGGSTTEFERDAVGRLTSIRAGDVRIDIAVEDATGRVRSVTTADGDTATWEHDGPLVVSETTTGHVEGTVERRYGHKLQPDAVIVDETALPIEYAADGALAAIGPVRIDHCPTTGLVRTIAAGSVVTTRTHDRSGALVSQRTHVGDRLLLAEEITRDANGRVTKITETDAGGDHEKSYRYDANGLIDATHDGVPDVALERDRNGNIITCTRREETREAVFDAADRIVSLDGQAISWGPDGEMLGDDKRRQEFDPLGRLTDVAAHGQPPIHHTYDGVGRLIESSADGATYLQVLWDGDRPAAVGDRNRVRRICVSAGAGIAPEALLEGDRILRLVTDHRGSVRLVVDAATGEVVQQLDYDALGRRVVDTHPGLQPFGFTGCLHDPYTGLVHMRRRVLDPRGSRFLTPDPRRFEGGQTNLYTYAGNDPINRRDPDGTQSSPSGGVEVCTAPFIGSNSTPSIDHVFLKTENWSRGQAMNPDATTFEKLTLQTEWSDETTHPQGKDRPGMSDDAKATCRPVENVDEKCLDAFTQPGTSTGTYGLDVTSLPPEPNVCYDQVFDALDACAGPGGWEYGETEFGTTEGPRTLAEGYRVIREMAEVPSKVWDWLTSD